MNAAKAFVDEAGGVSTGSRGKAVLNAKENGTKLKVQAEVKQRESCESFLKL